MAPRAKRRQSNGLRRRKALREVSSNVRWLHLGAGAISVRGTLHSVWRHTSLVCSYSSFLLSFAMTIETFSGGNSADMEAIHLAIELFSLNLTSFMSLLEICNTMDHLLHDISSAEESLPLQFTRHKALQIDDLTDPQSHKMTHFYHGQLVRLYNLFDLDGFLNSIGEAMVPIYTGHSNARGIPCRYLIDPQELFLFTLTKLAKGRTNISIIDEYFGGDYARWSHGYRWMLQYIDDRYEDILGHQGLARFVKDFPRFHRAIEQSVQKDRNREQPDGTWILIPGLVYLPMWLFGFSDDSLYRTNTPFSGPRGDYEGAARKEEYAETQQSVYTGYNKFHGIKVETIFLPNGITTVFGPCSARRGDAGLLQMSNLNAFLSWLQYGTFFFSGRWVVYSVFGDSAFDIGMECLKSYYRTFTRGAELTDEERRVNHALKAARITIEKNYAMIGNIFRICQSTEGFRLAKKVPYALEQLRVCHLLTNCYVCLNGDQSSSTNTFDCSPPTLEEYLEL